MQLMFRLLSELKCGGTSVNRNQKTDLVKTLRGTFEDSTSVVVVHCIGLTVAESTDLRNKMRNDNCSFKVTKNKITRKTVIWIMTGL